MARNRRTGRDLDVRLGTLGAPADGIRNVRRNLIALEKNRGQENRSIARELRALNRTYRRDVSDLLGAAGMRKLRQLRARRSAMSRAQRARAIDSLFDELDVDRAGLRRLQSSYDRDVRDLVVHGREKPPKRPPRLPGECGPWVTYTAPYHGYFWSFEWERSSNADDPVLTSYLDVDTGRIGSSIQTRLSGADDDDRVTAEYYTSFNVWHTALGTGPLEVYLAFEFTTSNYSGKVKDEFGISDATWHQWGGAHFLAYESDTQFDAQDSRIIHVIDNNWGDDASWSNYAEKPRDMHWYYFRTAANFNQGTPVLLEAGIDNLNWFWANDESVTLSEDLDLRLDRIMVRSCPPDIIL